MRPESRETTSREAMVDMKTRPISGALILTAALLVAGCATNPVTGRQEFSLVTPSQEIQIGREGHEAVLKEYGAYQDTRLQAYVDSVGQALARVSHQPSLEWHFTVLDDPTVNAFALPGGYIYITRGILAHLNSEAQLAGVLGHEIGHVTARHHAHSLTQQQLAGLGLGLASIFSEGFRRYSNAAQTALGLVFLKYSRDNENQADELGVGYTAKAGFDPREIPGTYRMLKRVGERSGQRLPGFLSTHPDPGDRETRTTALASQAATGRTGLKVGGRSHLLRLDGVVFGNDPRHGYFDGGWFYHPELAFQMRFPAGWKTQNSRSAVIAVEPNDRAGMQLTLADAGSLSPSGYVQELERSGQIASSDGRSESIGGLPGWVGYLAITGQDGTRVGLVAAFIRKGSMFQVLGRSAVPGDANESRILESARSFRELTDRARLDATPDRIDIVTVSQPGPFAAVVARYPAGGVDVDELAILNDVERDETVRSGQLLKIVVPGRR